MTQKGTTTIPEDLKYWYAISCPTTGLRFDARTLELLDTNGDGRIRSDEVAAALDFLRQRGVSIEALQGDHAEDEKALSVNLAKQADLDGLEPSELEKAALAEWEVRGNAAENQPCGADTPAAEAALAAIEGVIDAFFTPPEDMPLVTDEPDKILPLKERINPRNQEAILTFAEECVIPILGERSELTRLDWKAIKAAFAPYRAWRAAKPVVNADARNALIDEERLLRYRMHLGEFLRNYVSMDDLYDADSLATFQTGVLRIDGKEMNLCFHVENEGAHAALSGKSECCVIYLKLTRAGEGLTRSICAVVTAGTIGGLYVGRNGVFYDRDGRDWDAVVTKLVEANVSLSEAFWSPWKKLGEGIGATVRKFLSDRQTKAVGQVQKGTESATGGGAALASSVAAIGIGVGVIGAAFASIAAVLRGMTPEQLLLAVIVIILLVSLPSAILTWFKLRRRDLAAILNASGWAVNRPMRFSMARARGFTQCARTSEWWLYALLTILLLVVLGGVFWGYFSSTGKIQEQEAAACADASATTEVK